MLQPETRIGISITPPSIVDYTREENFTPEGNLISKIECSHCQRDIPEKEPVYQEIHRGGTFFCCEPCQQVLGLRPGVDCILYRKRKQ